ncbi:hypothetical protein GCM10010103_56180 [Streptomyces paradoxus]|uniref:Thiamine pyrophosphate-dependent acetolactate synthase large subunit-like protein n=1 Tax=Streptomyces paradoxus TaxID=66375 RepID=A0A7W9TFL2_9ACTN|nr:thiamine pyrophosphate-dependent enzyme [Streptomyces paradoxus]MBB6079376.1 thiamine pyrophosphate-dependent acetolactate synthase large subunit-like protein [Streptomyces paradoxus]
MSSSAEGEGVARRAHPADVRRNEAALRHIGTEFSHPDGSPCSPDSAAMGRAFGIESWKVNDAASLEPTLRKAVQSGAPALVEVPTDRDAAGP